MSDNPGNTAILEAITALRATVEERSGATARQLATLRADLMDRLDRLQESIEALREESVVNTASNDIARRGHDRLHEMALSLQRQIQRMQVRLEHLEKKP